MQYPTPTYQTPFPATDQGQALPSGTRIEEFVIERVLGSGGFGITYLARDTALGRQVVIKENLPVQFCFRDTHSLTVAPRHTNGDDADNFKWSLENFSREAAMLASLDHPGIVKVLRSFEAFGTAYFVMPFVEGVALDELAKKRDDKPFTEEELRELLERLLGALDYLHTRNIYHRDIKPGNILITSDGAPVLIDFGSARQRLSERSITVVESPGYTPFEQLQTRGNVGPWSDLYALGATLVKLMTGGAPPKTNDRTMGDPWPQLADRAELRGRFSELFLRSLDRALRLPIEERWQCAGDWKQALSSAKVLEATIAKPETATPNGRKKSGARALVALSALALLGIGGWWILGSAGNPVKHTVTTGGLVITSEPTGAQVLDVGGTELGVTPLELKNLPGGEPWEASMAMPGYVTAKVLADVPTGKTYLVPPVRLQPEPQKVVVTSEPAGAEIVESDKLLGTTPWESEAREVGSKVKLVLRKDGYEVVSLTGEVELGKSLELHARLKAAPQKVVVTSEPAGAEIVEGDKVLGITPWESEPREMGSAVNLVLRKDGYQNESLAGEIELGNSLELHGSLKAASQKVVVTSEPEGAEVLKEDAIIGKTPFEQFIIPGTVVSYLLRLDGHEEGRIEGKVEIGEALKLHASLKPMAMLKFAGKRPGEEKVIEIATGVKMRFCWIPPGEFLMGSPGRELGRDDDESQHQVTISKGFWMAKGEVTQAQWRSGGGIDTTSRPPSFSDGKERFRWEDYRSKGVVASNFVKWNFEGDMPAERMDWREARDWCLGLTERLHNAGLLVDGWEVAMPTEAQWEYACRAGTTTALNNGRNLTSREGSCANLNEVAWYDGNSDKKTHQVGRKKPNAWGLHDMHGNVWEWCANWYAKYPSVPAVDPTGPAAGSNRVSRGGSWGGNPGVCRSAVRGKSSPDGRGIFIGLRPILQPVSDD